MGAILLAREVLGILVSFNGSGCCRVRDLACESGLLTATMFAKGGGYDSHFVCMPWFLVGAAFEALALLFLTAGF